MKGTHKSPTKIYFVSDFTQKETASFNVSSNPWRQNGQHLTLTLLLLMEEIQLTSWGW